jgi:hypothetical protein
MKRILDLKKISTINSDFTKLNSFLVNDSHLSLKSFKTVGNFIPRVSLRFEPIAIGGRNVFTCGLCKALCVMSMDVIHE